MGDDIEKYGKGGITPESLALLGKGNKLFDEVKEKATNAIKADLDAELSGMDLPKLTIMQ
jgi:hypothetical protein